MIPIPSLHAFEASSGLVYNCTEIEAFEILYSSLLSFEHEMLYNNEQIKSIDLEYCSKWPIHKVSWWSRPYEYAFIINRLNSSYSKGLRNFYELGPGCSIMPWLIAKYFPDAQLTVCDTDATALSFAESCFKLLSFNNYNLRNSFLPEDLVNVDLLYSISVLEHIPECIKFLSTISKALKTGSELALTLDIDLKNGKHGITMSQYKELLTGLLPSSFIVDSLHINSNSKLLTNQKSWYFSDSSLPSTQISSNLFSRAYFRSLISKIPTLAVAKLALKSF